MIKALPIQSKEEQEIICNHCGAEYDADLMAYEVVMEDKLIGVCQFTIDGRGGSLRCLSQVHGSDDTQAMFVLGRATLNFIDLCGIKTAYYDGADAEKLDGLLRLIGFKKTDGEYKVDLEHFFEHPCQHS